MDYANERWVRLYVRDTTTWKLLTWEARALLTFLLRKVDRSGVLEVGEEGIDGLTAHVEMPPEVVERALPQLLKRGVVVDGEVNGVRAFSFPNFEPAQETPASDRQRAIESRANRRARAIAASRIVTQSSQNAAKSSQAVTGSHSVSHAVTLSETDKTDKTDALSGKPEPPLLVLTPDPETEKPKSPEPAADLAAAAVAEINRLSGRAFGPDAAETVKLCRVLVRERLATDDVLSVIRFKADWIGDPKMGRYFAPSTLLALSNVRKYLDEMRAGPARGPAVNVSGFGGEIVLPRAVRTMTDRNGKVFRLDDEGRPVPFEEGAS